MKKLFFVCFLFAWCIQSCKRESTMVEFSSENFARDFAEIVVQPNYQNLMNASNKLNQLSVAFSISQNDSILLEIRNQWKLTRQHWELTESFLFGPVANLEIDPAIDDWPINYVDLDSVMVQNSIFTPQMVMDFPTSLKGFHAIEYLIFGRNGIKNANEFTIKEIQYLRALTEVLFINTTQLVQNWESSGSTFYHEWCNAGNNSSIYLNRKSVALELVASIGGIIAEVGEEKIGAPFLAFDSTLEESQFSQNSFVDFTNNILGAKNAYLCSFQGKTGVSLSEFVKKYNKALNDQILIQFDFVISNLKSYKKPFSNAIFMERSQLESTISNINKLSELFDVQLYSLVNQKYK